MHGTDSCDGSSTFRARNLSYFLLKWKSFCRVCEYLLRAYYPNIYWTITHQHWNLPSTRKTCPFLIFLTYSYTFFFFVQDEFVQLGVLHPLVAILRGHCIPAQMKAALAIDALTQDNHHAQIEAAEERAPDGLCRLFQVGGDRSRLKIFDSRLKPLV